MNVKKAIITVIVCVCVGIACWWLLFGRESVYDNGDTINTAREQSERIGKYQQSASDSINTVRDGLDDSINAVGRIEERTGRIEESIDSVERRNTESLGLIGESTDRIRESKSIIDSIREGKE